MARQDGAEEKERKRVKAEGQTGETEEEEAVFYESRTGAGRGKQNKRK